MYVPSFRRGRSPVHRRPDERMTKSHLRADHHDAGRFGVVRRCRVDPHRPRGGGHQRDVRRRLRGGGEQPRSRVDGQPVDLLAIVDLELIAERDRIGDGRRPAEFGGRQLLTKIDQGERVPCRRVDDPRRHLVADRRVDRPAQELDRVGRVESGQLDRRQPVECGRCGRPDRIPNRIVTPSA